MRVKILLFFLVFSNFGYTKLNSSKGNLLFTFMKRVEFNKFHDNTSFTLLDNGRFSFRTSTGGFHLCGNSKTGSFKGILSQKELNQLVSEFKQLDNLCPKMKNCTKKDDLKNHKQYQWKILGWGEYSDQSYFFKTGNKKPYLFQRLFALESKLYSESIYSLKINKVNEDDSKLTLNLIYQGEKKYNFDQIKKDFVLFNESGENSISYKSIKINQTGNSAVAVIDKKKVKMKKGDFIIVTSRQNHELSPCHIIK